MLEFCSLRFKKDWPGSFSGQVVGYWCLLMMTIYIGIQSARFELEG